MKGFRRCRQKSRTETYLLDFVINFKYNNCSCYNILYLGAVVVLTAVTSVGSRDQPEEAQPEQHQAVRAHLREAQAAASGAPGI